MDKLRVGMIGTSGWADGRLLPNLSSHPCADVAAICGRSRERAESLAKKYGIARVYSDYRQMIEKAALDAGLHVVCEKPLASNAQQAREMTEKAEAAGVKHMVFFTNRWLPPYQFVAHLMQDGAIGRVFDCTLTYLSGFGLNNP